MMSNGAFVHVGQIISLDSQEYWTHIWIKRKPKHLDQETVQTEHQGSQCEHNANLSMQGII